MIVNIRSLVFIVAATAIFAVSGMAQQSAPAPQDSPGDSQGAPPTSREEPETLDTPDDEVPDYAVDESEVDIPDEPIFHEDDMGDEWEHIDTTDDGDTDYAVIVNSDNDLIRAAMDYSGDGYFDNFYYYDSGELNRHELDTNNDGQIDVRVFLVDGTNVRRFEQDTNHDGTMDLEEDYEE